MASRQICLLFAAVLLTPSSTTAEVGPEAVLGEATRALGKENIELFGHSRREAPGPVLVTGATGRTGRLVYESLKEQGFPVRSLKWGVSFCIRRGLMNRTTTLYLLVACAKPAPWMCARG